MSDANAARTGRRAGDSTTRDDILTAARELFASTGFTGTTLRAVAARAGVDVALIPYYFGNKRGLFVASIDMPHDPAERIAAAIPGPRSGLGLRLATVFLTTWEDEKTGPILQSYLRSAVSDPSAAASFGEFASQAMLPLVAEEAALSAETTRALSAMLFGLATMRYLLAAPDFTEQSTDELIAMCAPRVQALIDAD